MSARGSASQVVRNEVQDARKNMLMARTNASAAPAAVRATRRPLFSVVQPAASSPLEDDGRCAGSGTGISGGDGRES